MFFFVKLKINKMALITITIKIQLNICNADKKATWKQLYEWQNIVREPHLA